MFLSLQLITIFWKCDTLIPRNMFLGIISKFTIIVIVIFLGIVIVIVRKDRNETVINFNNTDNGEVGTVWIFCWMMSFLDMSQFVIVYLKLTYLNLLPHLLL